MWKNRIAWLLILLAALGFYLFENNAGTRILLCAAVILPAVSALLLYLPRVRLTAALELPEELRRGEAAGGTLRLCNQGRFPLSGFRAALSVRNRLTGEAAVLPVRCAVGAGRTVSAAFTLTAAHCGKLAVSLENAVAADFLGLFARALPVTADAAVLVPPRTFPLSLSLAETADFLTDSRSYSTQRPGYDPSETFRIREYIPGDPVRQIHWKLSEKTGQTLVRDFGLPVVSRMLLLLETAKPEHVSVSPADMDLLLDALASVSGELLAMEIPHTVGWRDHAADGFASREIAAEEDLAALWDALLSNPIACGADTVAGAYARDHAACASAHVALFSAYVPPDADLLFHGNRVTTLLPREGAAQYGVEQVVLDREALRGGSLRLEL